MTQATQKRIFITGTDTDAGKTLVTCALIECLQAAGRTVMAVKPVAAGCELIDGQLRNSDALQMQQHLDKNVDYASINPIALASAIAPHIAAKEEQRSLSVTELSERSSCAQFDSEFVLIEGAGGWLVPLNSEQSFADFVVQENLEVVLVVGMKLGCINHALLTVEAIKSRGLKLVGWVACSVTGEMQRYQENIDYLINAIDAPLLGEIPYIKVTEEITPSARNTHIVQTASSYVNIAPLLQFNIK